jgi:hypothetical protein
MATNAGRATVANGSNPDPPPLPEPDVADMEYFLEQIEMMFPVLGMNFLLPKPVFDERAVTSEYDSPKFVMKEGEKQAFAVEMGGEFVVLSGSPARKKGVPSWTSYRGQRDALIEDGKLVQSDDSDYYAFSENIGFASPSAAAAVIAAGNRNGRTYWKVEGTNETYADWHNAKLAAAEANGDGEGE